MGNMGRSAVPFLCSGFAENGTGTGFFCSRVPNEARETEKTALCGSFILVCFSDNNQPPVRILKHLTGGVLRRVSLL